jgi:hypothetical protein
LKASPTNLRDECLNEHCPPISTRLAASCNNVKVPTMLVLMNSPGLSIERFGGRRWDIAHTRLYVLGGQHSGPMSEASCCNAAIATTERD